MKSFTPLIVVVGALVCASLATAAPSSIIKRDGVPSGSDCAGSSYSGSQLQQAINAALDDASSGNRPDDYPHAYYDYPDEDITLVCSGNGPWSEFPLKHGSIYTGGSPGADRVIYDNDSGDYCATVTHTGAAQKNGFVQCDDY